VSDEARQVWERAGPVQRGPLHPGYGVNSNAMFASLVVLVLLAVAIPSFTRKVKRNKSSEATGTIARIWQAELNYFHRAAETGAGRFVSAGPTPSASPTEAAYPTEPRLWTGNAGWSALGVVLAVPHRYQYRVTATGDRGEGGFVVTAIGNLDGDTVFSTFSRAATVSAGEIQGARYESTNELE
jgi:hypothetical protein